MLGGHLESFNIMAKTRHVGLADCPGPSTSTAAATRPPRRRRHQRSRPLAPSSTLLSFLATVAGASVADGSPAPPAFLCPSLESTEHHTKARRAPAPPSTSSAPTPTTRSTLATTTRQYSRGVYSNIAYKFAKGEDGIWRKEDAYDLYGVCAGCDSVLDGQISKANSTMPSNNLKADIESNLPPGWKPTPKRPANTMLILAISLVLAFFISFLIIGCLFWRKNIRWKNKDKDVEKRRRKRRRRRTLSTELSEEAIREMENDKEAKAKQRLWARATARWRANARHSARQRRGKRLVARPSTISVNDSGDDSSSDQSSRPPSPSLSRSRRSSTSSFHQEPVSDLTPIPSIAVQTPEPTALPPAYQQKSTGAQTESSEYLSRRPSSASLLVRSRRPSHSAAIDEASSTAGQTVAHVATDDKNVLAMLAEMASAPPAAAHETRSEPEVSVPEWHDEQIEDFNALQRDHQTLSEESPNGSIPSSPFPAPPSKGNLLSPDFYDYPYSFEEMTGDGPVYGPSAPPFEETPSAPLVDEETMEVVPSAPPLIDDDDFYAPEQIPSAPPQEDAIPTTVEGASAPSQEDGGPSPPASSGGILPVYRP